MGEKSLKGIAASEGIAIGPAYCYIPARLDIPVRTPELPELGLVRFKTACETARAEIAVLRASVAQRTKGEELAAIFDAHQEILDDPLLAKKVVQGVQQGLCVEQAVADTVSELADMLAGMEDELFAARALDIQDVGRRILRILLGLPDTSLKNIQTPAIIIAQDLTPSDTANLDPRLTLGFCTAEGGLTSHSAILARTLGIPAVVGLGKSLLDTICAGEDLVLDGIEGQLVITPEYKTLERYRTLKAQREDQLLVMKAQAHQPACTANGRRVEIAANIGEVETAREALEYGAEGVGLLRTEFLYLNETQPPSEEKQLHIYREIFETFGELPVIIRTLDIGGDKPPSYLHFPNEMNPFLGWRAIRISLDETDLFKTQLRAILRAAVGHDIRIMFPMISGLDELLAAREILEQAKAGLAREGLPFAPDLPVGIMVETPAAAVLVDVLASASDFFSLGTNDLTQYTLAVDRGNQQVARLFQPLHPAVLRLIAQTIDSAHSKGKWVGMCGELAGMTKAIPILLGLGLDEFSMAARSVPQAKYLISKLSDEQARQIAAEAMRLGTAAEIEDYMQKLLPKYLPVGD